MYVCMLVTLVDKNKYSAKHTYFRESAGLAARLNKYSKAHPV